MDRYALHKLKENMQKDGFKSATLGGVQIIRTDEGWLFVRDPVMAKGRKDYSAPVTPVTVTPGLSMWDGRFEVRHSGKVPLTIRPAWGYIEKFSDALKHIPAAARPTVPIILNENNEIVQSHEALTIGWLGFARLGLV